MKYSLRLFSWFGIDVFVHWSFSVLLLVWFWLGFSADQGWFEMLVSLLLLLAVFACVTLHEFGHSLMAQRFGIDTVDITLLPIGGVARLERIPKIPVQELWIAVAGPAVNVVIGALVAFCFWVLRIDYSLSFFSPVLLSGSVWANFWFNILWVNIFLVLFNAIPAFPMDGGRVLRAVLSFRLRRSFATKIATVVGRVFAVAFVLVGIYTQQFNLTLIGLYVYYVAGLENRMVQQEHRFSQGSVRHVLNSKPSYLLENDPLNHLFERASNELKPNFLIVDDTDQLVGIVAKEDLAQQIVSNELNKNEKINQLMNTDFVSLNLDNTLQEAKTLLSAKNQSFAPVYYEKNVIGIADLDDILAYLKGQA